MNSDIPVTIVRREGHPVFRFLVSFPIACFCGALVTDGAYAVSANVMWADFSTWLLAAGFGLGVVAAIVGLVGMISHRRLRPRRPIAALAIGGLIVLAVGLLNNLVHSRDAWTSVMPQGLALSAVTVVLIILTAWLDAASLRRRQGAMTYVEARA
jgi:uncharacterized membrane protein